jgi:hypothetical protein
MKKKKYGFYLNGEILLKTVLCDTEEQAYEKLIFAYPTNFNITIKFIETIEL